MPRYVVQPDDVSCGPTAILNAMRWGGVDVTIKHFLPFLQFGCRTIDLENPTNFEDSGTSNQDFDRILRYVGKSLFKIRRTHRPTLPMMIRHLQSGGSIALGYFWQDGVQQGEHFCFLVGYKRGLIITVNDHIARRGAMAMRSPKRVRKWLKRIDDSPVAWFLTKEKSTQAA